MIALQARGGRVADPARITAQYANMMTAKRQAEAAQTQGALARQTMANNQASEMRAQETQITAQQKAKFEYTKGLMAEYTNRLAKIDASDKTRYSNLRQQIIQDIPTLESELPTPDEWNEKSKFLVISDAEKFLRYKYATPVASTAINDRTGQLTSITAGGPDPRAEVIGEVPFQSATSTAPRAAPTAPQAAGPVPAGEFGEARFVPEESIPLTPFQEEDIRRIQAGSGASQPASFSRGASAGQITPEVAQQIVDTAVKTGMMAQADFDQLMTLAPDQNKQPFMDMLKANNITLQPGGMGQQSQYADLRGPAPQSQTAGLRGAPPMEQTMLQSQGRTPFIPRRESPAPAEIPLERRRQEALVQRESAGEVYAKEKARARAQREALLEAGPKPLTAPQEAKLRANITKDYKSARSTIDMMLNPVAGVVAAVNNVRKLSPAQKEAITGYSGYLPTIYAGTKSADTAVKNLKGKVTEMGKSVAALTGAIGQMAVQEWRIVSDMIASLDLEGMGAADLDNQLDIIEAQARRAAEVTRDAYENQYIEEFDRYPGRFRLPDAAAVAAPAAKRKTPTKGAVDRNNPLLRN
jgi:hypothetical protein